MKKDKPILIFYFNVGGLSHQGAVEVLHQNRVMIERTLLGEPAIFFLVPKSTGENSVECINPKVVSEEEYSQVKETLTKLEKIIEEYGANTGESEL
jgi:hypothetical protein